MARCKATAKTTRERCRRSAAAYQEVCAIHGAKSPQALAAAERRRMAAEAAERWPAVERDPSEALIEAAKEADRFAQAVAAAARDRGMPGALTSTRVDDGARRVEIAALLDALGQWLDRVGRLSSAVVTLRLDERRVQLAEAQGQLIEGVIRGILGDLAARLRASGVDAYLLNVEWPVWVGEIAPRRLREAIAVAGEVEGRG